MKSRRSFLKLMATGSAAVLAGAATAAAAPAPARRPARSSRTPRTALADAPPVAASPSEIRKQKEQTAATLKTIRAYALPPGSEPAFAFVPMPASPRSRTGRRKDRP
jgi:hypothetical protein